MKTKKRKPTPEGLTVGLHSRIPNSLFREIEEVANAESRTVSNMVRLLLVEALAHRKGSR